MEAANGVFRGHAAGAPPGFGLDALDAAQRQPGPVLILERDRCCAEAFDGRIVGDALLDQALGPVADRAFRDAEDRFLRLPDPEPARRGALPCEEGQDRARMASGIAVIEVIGAGIVEIDGFLDQAQAKRSIIEIEVPARRARDARHMMDAARHGFPLCERRLYAPRCRRPTEIGRRRAAGSFSRSELARRARRPAKLAGGSKPLFGSRSRQAGRRFPAPRTARRRAFSKAPARAAVRPALVSNMAAPPDLLALAR